jgi:peptidoglycan biosynthesis protein MviN/MurJ (putative lipid II flippase)
MKLPETLKSETAQHAFEATFIVVVLIILPMLGDSMGKYGGGIAMLAAALAGLIVYCFLYWQRLRNRGLLKTGAIAMVGRAVIAVVVALLNASRLWR